MRTLSNLLTIRRAYCEWLSELHLEGYWFVTLNFNRNVGLNFAHCQLRTWAGRVDRTYLGHNWSKKPTSERTLAARC
jgi:hypothetical protein